MPFTVPSAASMMEKWQPCHELSNYTPLLPIITNELMEQAVATGAPQSLDGNSDKEYKLTVFDSVALPGVSPADYLAHIQRHSRSSSAMWICMYILIQRITKIGGIAFTPLRAHRMLLTAATIASKVTDDLGRSNKSYGMCGGLKTLELNMLEEHFLIAIDFDSNVLPNEWDETVSKLTAAAHAKGLLAHQMANECTTSPQLFPGSKLLDFVEANLSQLSTPPYSSESDPASSPEPSPGPEDDVCMGFVAAEKTDKGGQPGFTREPLIAQAHGNKKQKKSNKKQDKSNSCFSCVLPSITDARIA